MATVAVLLYGGDQVIHHHIEIGVLVGFLAALNNFFDPITQLSQLYTTYQSGMAALDKIFELLDEEPEMRERTDARTLARIRGELRFEHVSFAYRRRDGERDRLALDDVDLTVAPGETVALVGATGAGKSTFAKLVARFYDPTLGRVLIDGNDVRDLTYESLRGQLGIVPQEAFLFSGTVSRTSPSARRAPKLPRSRRRRAPSARTTSSRRSSMATTPRSASAARSCRPASASSSPSRGR